MEALVFIDLLTLIDVRCYTSARPMNGAEGIMFTGCPSLCACVPGRRLAVDF